MCELMRKRTAGRKASRREGEGSENRRGVGGVSQGSIAATCVTSPSSGRGRVNFFGGGRGTELGEGGVGAAPLSSVTMATWTVEPRLIMQDG